MSVKQYVNWRAESPEPIRSFLFYLETIRSLSPNTVTAYFIDLRSFCRFRLLQTNRVSKNTPFQEISIDQMPIELIRDTTITDILEYLSYLNHEQANSTKTRARKVSALRTFYKYLIKQAGILDKNPLDNLDLPSPPKTLPKHLTLDESRTLLTVASNAENNQFQERDLCIFTLFLNCGMRLSELVDINLSDIQDRKITITGKGNKQRIAYLNDACIQALNGYLAVRRQKTDVHDKDALFLSHLGKRITNRGVQMIMAQYMDMLGLTEKGYTVHKLRHTAATLMYQYGHVDIRTLQVVLGHENLATTEIYTHVANDQVQAAVESSPLADYAPKPRKSRKKQDPSSLPDSSESEESAET